MKKFTLRPPVTIATILSLLVLAAALAVLAQGIRNQSASFQSVVHTREVLENVQSTIAHTSEAEAAQRGFLLTGSTPFLASYRQARDAVLPQVAELRLLTQDNPRQQASLREFEGALRTRFDLLERVLQEQQAGHPPTLATLESGLRLKERILALSVAIRAEEQRLLGERQARVEAGRRELIAAFATTGATAIALVVLLWVLSSRDAGRLLARAQALSESEANYRYTIELNPQIPWRASPAGAIETFSDRWLSLTGQAREAVPGAGWSSAVLDEDRPAMLQAWAQAVANGEPLDVEFRIRATAGEARWMRSRAAPRRDETGAIVAWYGLTEDIHTRKESELALSRRLAQIETIYRAVPVGLGLLDADLRLAELNDALADAAGRSKRDMIGVAPMLVLPPPLGERVGAVLEQVVRDCRQVSGVEFSSSVDGDPEAGVPARQRDWLASFYPVLDGARLEGVVVALLEVTQIKAAQRKLIEANQLLEQRVEERTEQIAEANAELRAFAHTVAHDLRAPLRNVEGFATALLEDEAERMSEDGRMFAGRIVAAVVRMDRLITDLLAYSRLSRSELRLERVELGAVVKTVLRDLEAQVAESGARFELAWPLPVVRGNATILVQVIANLVSNAIKFVDKGVTPRIAIAGMRDGAVVRLLIGDNGIGIAPEHREHVFGVFERLHGHERYPGTGIGLAIVKKGLERMEGTVRILDREGGGTTFELAMQAAD
ncbi:CHASE3 domain-containing protein [Massilia sp. IC2-476]|uniref:sensor histidine kinase n=1 Tax=Massilia sp. IC2-476 TaxID=2887199 RepID=UPI001D0F50A9|nr:CHASE3 domain-containing protein [Massilia sp. IC2-476]MCC2973382.1 CHASE3 domain-containing protein [Massilia sp. IC2-476]